MHCLETDASLPACLPSLCCSEAVCLDPQARMLLEHTQELLAAPASTLAADAVGTSIGLYVGCMYTGERKRLGQISRVIVSHAAASRAWAH